MSYQFEHLKVLVVDDNVHMRTLVCRILNTMGIKTIYDATNAKQAWEVFGLNPVDIIFVDWVMDGMNGVNSRRRCAMRRILPIPSFRSS